MAKLTLRVADGSTREVSLDEHGSLTIGRSPECEIHLDEVQASRRHCTVVRLQSGFEIADLGSTNGTLVNGQLTKRKKLQLGDVIRIGQSEITFVDESAARSSGAESKTCSLVWTKGVGKIRNERVDGIIACFRSNLTGNSFCLFRIAPGDDDAMSLCGEGVCRGFTDPCGCARDED